jgi:hypothetical protein
MSNTLELQPFMLYTTKLIYYYYHNYNVTAGATAGTATAALQALLQGAFQPLARHPVVQRPAVYRCSRHVAAPGSAGMHGLFPFCCSTVAQTLTAVMLLLGRTRCTGLFQGALSLFRLVQVHVCFFVHLYYSVKWKDAAQV